MAKKQSTRTASRATSAAPKRDSNALEEGTYLVSTPAGTFSGTRCGVGFASGRGLASAGQAQTLRDVYGYDVERVEVEADGEADETAASSEGDKGADENSTGDK